MTLALSLGLFGCPAGDSASNPPLDEAAPSSNRDVRPFRAEPETPAGAAASEAIDAATPDRSTTEPQGEPDEQSSEPESLDAASSRDGLAPQQDTELDEHGIATREQPATEPSDEPLSADD